MEKEGITQEELREIILKEVVEPVKKRHRKNPEGCWISTEQMLNDETYDPMGFKHFGEPGQKNSFHECIEEDDLERLYRHLSYPGISCIGSCLNDKDENGQTPMHLLAAYACRHGKEKYPDVIKVVKLIKSFGGAGTVKDSEGKTAWQMAPKEIQEYFKPRKLNIDPKTLQQVKKRIKKEILLQKNKKQIQEGEKETFIEFPDSTLMRSSRMS